MKKIVLLLSMGLLLFSCGPQENPDPGIVFGSFTDSRDGNEYKTVTIGSQVWMAENLAYLPEVHNSTSDSGPHYYVYGYDGTEVTEAKAYEHTPGDNDEYSPGGAPIKVYETYGVLYNWPAAITACPEGWHLPSDAEWKQLEMYLGMSEEEADRGGGGERGTDEGGKLKEAGNSHWHSPNSGATNESGFTALPGGYRFTSGDVDAIGIYGDWWSSTGGTDSAWRRYLHCSSVGVGRVYRRKDYTSISVRCLQDNNLLSVSTGTVTNITTTTASCSGNVTSDGGSSVTARGVCWSTSQNPTIANSKTTDGTGLGTYTSNITGLSPNTTYYVRAYATNAEGTAYGNQQSFKTKEDPDDSREPTVTTKNVSNITQTTATCGGNVTDAGSSKVTARGVCWDTSKNPTKSDSKTTDGSGTGSYTSQLTGLQSNCKYYVRAYATNSEGTSYGDQISFYTKASGKSVTPSNSCSSAPIIDPYTTYNVNINVGDYDLAPPIETHSYGSANVRGFWIAFRTISDWGPDHDVKIFNVSNNFDPVFGIRNACISPYLAHFSNNYYGYMDKNGKGGDETSDTNLPGSASGANLDDLYYVRIYHYVGSETPSITFSIRVE
jgi:uncharacterized protein (TIGR02145 family)